EQLVRLMGGTIGVKSQPGAGSTFTFTIKTSAGISKHPALSIDGLSEHAGKRVLIVDDNHTNRTILKTQLEFWDLTPVLAASGVEALNLLSSDSRYDLVLTDMQMPYMDGIRLSQSIRDRYPQLPIILLSSVGDEYKKNHTQLFSAVMTKPIKQQAMYRHILSTLQNQGRSMNDGRPAQPRLPEELATSLPLKLLVAEDNQVNQQVILYILQKLGYTPTIVENGQQAITAVTSTAYDIILMDLQMPEMDGLEATRYIRSAKLTEQPVIIALTANAMEGDEDECLQAGMNDYISKPVKLEELVGKLRKWALHRRRS
ncbi:MAG TPA: response regulator, partial [Puia sp.]